MNRSEYKTMRAKLWDDYQSKIDALDKVFAMLGGGPIVSGTAKQSGAAHAGPEWSHNVSKRDAVREILKSISSPTFTLKDVHAAITKHDPQMAEQIRLNDLSAILSILAKKNELKPVKHKIGKSPAVYSLPGAN